MLQRRGQAGKHLAQQRRPAARRAEDEAGRLQATTRGGKLRRPRGRPRAGMRRDLAGELGSGVADPAGLAGVAAVLALSP